jgi:hypothetical protein
MFLSVMSACFIAGEGYALATDWRNTLSQYAETELHYTAGQGFFQHNADWLLTQGVFLVIVFWLYWHIWYHKFW